MKMLKMLVAASVVLVALTAFAYGEPKSIYQFVAKDIIGYDVPLSSYRGKVLLIVNIASKCTKVEQLGELQTLYDELNVDGLEILAFPCNDFLRQEPKSNEEIRQFCTRKYAITFPVFSKISVKGRDTHPIYQYLTSKEANGVMDTYVKWNYQKYLIDREGRLVATFKPRVTVADPIFRQTLDSLMRQP